MREFMDTSKEVPILATLKEAIIKGAEVLVLGIAPSGGKIPESWNPVIEEALDNGLSIVNGLHDVLNERWSHHIKNPQKQWIWDVRIPLFIPEIATGKASQLQNKRVLFIGTDMAVGKMTAGLELYSWLLEHKKKVKPRAGEGTTSRLLQEILPPSRHAVFSRNFGDHRS